MVDKETFDRLCDNLHPTEDEPLTPRTNETRRVCKDLTFSGPKSFSIIEAFASEDERRRLRQAFDEAINETVDQDIEPDMQTRVRTGGADDDRTTGNVLTAGFDHSTARPKDAAITMPDPHRHQAPAGVERDAMIRSRTASRRASSATSCGTRAITRRRFMLAAGGQAGRAGLRDRPAGRQEWEIAGVPQSVIDKFSKRTAQIEAEAETAGHHRCRPQSRAGGEDPVQEAERADAAGAAQGMGCPTDRRGTRGAGGGLPQGDPGRPGRSRQRKRWRSPSPIARKRSRWCRSVN